MMRPGFRPALVMSTKCTASAAVPIAAAISSSRGTGAATATGSDAASPSRRKGTVPATYSWSPR